MKVLFLAQTKIMQPWYADFVSGLKGEHEVSLLNPDQPLALQFAGIGAVVDQGGVVGTHAMMDLAAAGGVKLWQVIGTGLDHVDVAYILGKGLTLANTPGQFSAVGLAEHAMFMMLYLARRLPETQVHIRAGRMCMPMGEELEGSTLALVGFGASARELAQRARAFGMRLLAVDAMPLKAGTAEEYGLEFLGGTADLPRIIEAADYVSLHTPLTEQTHHLLGSELLQRMKPTARIINVARGEIIDQAALLKALQEGRIAGAGLDVFVPEPLDTTHEFLRMDQVLATPHVAGMTNGTSRRRGQAAAENVRRVAAGMPPLYQIHAPV